jgi:HK97 gp10 family phage protein
MRDIVRLDGFDGLEAALHRLPTMATQRNVLRRTARGALESMADDAALKAPVLTGDLAFSVDISERRTRRVSRAIRFDRKNGVEMAMGPTSGKGVLNYAALTEFGTVDTPPQPFMRPAWDGGKDGALDYVKGHLWAEIDKAAKRVASKGARLLKAGL